MYERSLHVLEPARDLSAPMFPLRPAPKDPDELYLCGCCRVLLDRIIAPYLLERTTIVCPNCGAVNHS